MQNNNFAVSGSLTMDGITFSFADTSWERVTQIVEFITGSGAETVSSPEKSNEPEDFGLGCSGVIKSILDYVGRNPERFESRYESSGGFREAYPELAEYNLMQIGRSIGKIRLNHPEISRSKRYNPAERKYENRFLLPMPKISAEDESVAEADTNGYSGALKRAMKEHGFSACDVAARTGYPLPAVNGWLEGTVLPSTVAFEALRKLFGKDFIIKKEA